MGLPVHHAPPPRPPRLAPAVISSLEAHMVAVCARRGLTCRLHVKNEAAAVESAGEVVQELVAASAAAEGLLRRVFEQKAKHLPPLNANACPAVADGSSEGGRVGGSTGRGWGAACKAGLHKLCTRLFSCAQALLLCPAISMPVAAALLQPPAPPWAPPAATPACRRQWSWAAHRRCW